MHLVFSPILFIISSRSSPSPEPVHDTMSCQSECIIQQIFITDLFDHSSIILLDRAEERPKSSLTSLLSSCSTRIKQKKTHGQNLALPVSQCPPPFSLGEDLSLFTLPLSTSLMHITPVSHFFSSPSFTPLCFGHLSVSHLSNPGSMYSPVTSVSAIDVLY